MGILELLVLVDEERVPAEAAALIEKRAQARGAKDFAASDALRDQIAELGFTILDTPEGQKIEKRF